MRSPKSKKISESNKFKSLNNPYFGYTLLILGIAVLVYYAVVFNFTQDDAYITFRYAENYLNGDGLVFNVGERVEGYTNFLWLLFMIIGRLLGAEYVLFSKILGVAFGAGALVLIFYIARSIFKRNYFLAGLTAFGSGTIASFAYWSVAGLETSAFSFFVLLAVYLYMRKSYLVAVSAILASLLRPEGALLFALIILYEIIASRRISGKALILIGLYAVPLIPYLFFKLSYFGGILPNPFYAKTSFNLMQLSNGLEYVGRFYNHYMAYGILLLPFLITLKKWGREIYFPLFFVILYTLYILFIGGDVLKVHRFFLPLFPLYTLLIFYGLSRLSKNYLIPLVGLLICLGWQFERPREYLTTYLNYEKGFNAKLDRIMHELTKVDKTDFTLAVSTIGIVGYRLIGHDVIDILGLTDSTIARHSEPPIEGIHSTWKETKYNSKYLLERSPDYIMFSTGLKPSAPAEYSLFTYQAFLENYRPIAFYFGNYMHDIYKLTNPIETEPVSNISPLFGRLYNEAINKYSSGDYKNAFKLFQKSLDFYPAPGCPYVYYYLAEVSRQTKDHAAAYRFDKAGSEIDSTVYLLEKDLYIYEKVIMNNPQQAVIHLNRLARIIPWDIERVIKKVEIIERDYHRNQNRIEAGRKNNP